MTIRNLHIVDILGLAGLEQVVIRICNKLDKTEFSCSICAINGIRDDAKCLLNDDVSVYSLARCKNEFARILELYKIIQAEKIDVLHSHNWGTFPVAFMAAKLSGVKAVFHTEHGRNSLDPRISLKREFFTNLFYPKINKVFCVSGELKDYFQAKFKLKNNDLEVVYNGVPLEVYEPQRKNPLIMKSLNLHDSDLVIGTVAIPRPVKNLNFCLDVLKSLLEKGFVAKLLLVGGDLSGEGIQDLRNYAEAIGVKQHVIFTGRSNDIPALLSVFDLYLNSSVFEGTSCSIIEALSCGVPVVASRVGGNPEIVVDNENGFTFSFNDLGDCVSSVIKIMSDIDLRRRLSYASREMAIQRFSLSRQVALIGSAYRKSLCKQ